MSLPGADELFRTTGGMALSPSLQQRPAEAPRPETARAAEPAPEAAEAPTRREVPPARAEQHTAAPAGAEEGGEAAARRPRPRGRAPRRPSGRERHDEKITVYVSAEELMDLEHARLVLRGEHGLAVDRGRVVREAIAVVLADLEQRGESSILVRRLRGR
ncbi:hypothetical protein [Kitasatospora sp. MMS16-BH015]|uniref:hypothetical protein n=1 Tax=Kitasatospora sp. MMS16-BH015 TaxID=2018025 RepID=UPI000CF25D47|nr:hypothetical protein [Kitasatospora sp. MMS16-BH015]